MGTIEILIDEVKEYRKLKLISEMVPIKERIKLLENKYDCNFKNFEKKIKQQPENFKLWDDYIEWKAYQNKFDEIKEKIGEITHAKDITISRTCAYILICQIVTIMSLPVGCRGGWSVRPCAGLI